MDLKIRATAEYKDISIEDTYKFLETTADGLSDAEVKNRLEKFGTNELIEKKTNPLLEFLLRYWGPMPGCWNWRWVFPLHWVITWKA